MTRALSDLIADYEAAKSCLRDLISGSESTNDASIRTLDAEVSRALERLISAEAGSENEVLDRLRYFLQEARKGVEAGALMDVLFSAMERDINALVAPKGPVARSVHNSVAANKNSLVELCYCSRSCRPMTKKHLNEMCEHAAHKNHEIGITSVLAFDENTGAFLQVLEGEKEKVRSLMSRLFFDERHEKISVRFEGQIEKRMYEEYPLLLIEAADLRTYPAQQLDRNIRVKQMHEKSRALNQNYSYDWLMRSIGNV